MRVVLAALAGLALLAPAAHAVTPGEAVAALNAQRAAHGIPAGIVEVPAWSDGCAKHNAYQALNGGGLTHDEDPSRPGYTPEGDDAAGRAVLASGSSWADGNPWETAPIHLHQLLAPRLARTGAADGGGYSCMTTWGGTDRPAPAAPVTYSYPGDGTTHRPSETAFEGPYTPGELVGIPQGTTTGPYLYVMVDAPQGASAARVTAASLTGPDGAVELRTVDNRTSGLEGYLPAGAELIPVRPLHERATYTASVSLDVTLGDGSSVPMTRTWSFTTSEAPVTPVPESQPAQSTAQTVTWTTTPVPAPTPRPATSRRPTTRTPGTPAADPCASATSRLETAIGRRSSAVRKQAAERRALRRMRHRAARSGWTRATRRAYVRRSAQARERARRITRLTRAVTTARNARDRAC